MRNLFILLSAFAIFGCSPTEKNEGSSQMRTEVQTYLDSFNAQYQLLSAEVNEAAWALNTHIVEGDTTNAYRNKVASAKYAAYMGSSENLGRAKRYLDFAKENPDELTELQVRQLNHILYIGAQNDQSQKALIDERTDMETKQVEQLFGYDFKIDGKSVTTNQIDSILSSSKNLNQRLAAWQSSKEVGKTLKDGLSKLQQLRNGSVKSLGYPDFFSYQVSDYGMSADEMVKLNEKIMQQLWPLYRELHTYARYELAKQYGVKEVPDMIPAHWLSNRWGQDWSAMVDVKGLNIDSVLATKSAEWVMQQGEAFYKSIGFDALPKSFYEKSSLYPLPPNANYKKNNHASAWHMDLDKDVRSLMSVEPNADWYETVNHELGHIYYYMTYSTESVPPLLREGANRAYHEAFGTQIGLAALMKPFLAQNGLLPANSQTDTMQQLLKQALNYVVFIPWSSGTMTHFEADLYTKNLPEDEYNQRWWQYVQKYQGIAPPLPRTSPIYCDAASKTHINDDAAQYYDYALSFVLLFQFHDYIAKNILHQNPRECNYFGNMEVGNFLREMMKHGATRDGNELLKETIGNDLSAQPMLDYFAPLMPYLKEMNKGRKYTLAETI